MYKSNNCINFVNIINCLSCSYSGDHSTVELTLLRKMVMTMGQQFTIRENHATVATGIVTRVLESVNVPKSLGKLKLENKVGQ